MKQRVSPTFEYERVPVLWASATTFVCSTVAIFGLDRPSWIRPIAFVAGGVAAATGEFYSPAANNGFVGVTVALFPLFVLAFLYRVLAFPGAEIDGDAVFLGAVLASVDMLVYAPLMVLLGYIGGIVVDGVCRRVRPPIGY